ncbi:MAG: ABC transporter permease [Candidatus Aenigmarchaeota archaeon]|nr:ABC transporter permease [Candidatus Aenigmarchaeota archaeon]
MSELLKIIIRNLSYQRLRTGLTLLGIIIGVAAIVSMISIGDATQRSINEQFEKMGTNKIIITPGSPTSIGFSGATLSTEKLTKNDVDTARRIRGVNTAFGILGRTAEVKLGNEVRYATILAIPTENRKYYEELKGFEIEYGRDLRSSDKYSTVLGYLIRTKAFSKEIKVRDHLKINGKSFRVVGLLKKVGNPMDDMVIVIPMGAVKEIFNNTDEVSIIFVDVRKDYDVNEVADNIRDVLKKKRGIEDFKVQTFGDIMQMANKILGILKYLFIGIASISLLVGGIGIMNIMLMTVMERTKEIGVMKATGATNKIILSIFLGEAATVGLIGGLIGFLLGYGGSYFIGRYMGSMVGIPVKVLFSPELFIGSLIFSVIVGTLSGIYPAMRAAKLDPVEALRYE